MLETRLNYGEKKRAKRNKMLSKLNKSLSFYNIMPKYYLILVPALMAFRRCFILEIAK